MKQAHQQIAKAISWIEPLSDLEYLDEDEIQATIDQLRTLAELIRNALEA